MKTSIEVFTKYGDQPHIDLEMARMHYEYLVSRAFRKELLLHNIYFTDRKSVV